MNYELVIEDLLNISDPLVLHYAEKSSLALSWQGSSDKTQPIVGGQYDFTLENYDGSDAKYIEYFTTDEQRYRVTKRIEDTGEIVYQGFFLPETYEEPYEAAVHYVKFSATDGLGLLRGKQFDASFFEKEHYVTDVLCEILKMTGIPFDIYLAPAIKNHLNTKWHQIVIDGRKYFDDEKPPSVYEILEELISSMRCQLFQCEGRWYIEGINFRHLRKVKFDTYSIDGNYLGSFDVEKNIKVVDWSPTPSISLVPGLKEVNVTHEASKLTLPQEVFQETKISWVRAAGVVGVFNPRYWNYNFYVPKIRFPEYYLELPASFQKDLSPSNKIDLREKPYLLKGYKVRVKLAFQLLPKEGVELTSDEIAIRRASGIWIDMMVFKISLNTNKIFSNETTVIGNPQRLVFDGSLKANAILEFVAQENGFLNIELFEPRGIYADTLVGSVRLTNCEVEDLDQKKNFIYTETVNEDCSTTRDIDLALSDDVSTESKCFYLEKIRSYGENSGYSIEVPIKYGRQQNGKNYSIVTVEGAVLIEQFSEFVSHKIYFNKVENPKVHFNLNGSEEMAIETEGYYQDGSFWVIAKPYKPTTIDRTESLKWSDAVFQVEQKPYAQVVAEIEGKLFKDPHLMIEASVQNPIKFNDLIAFTFKDEKKYFVPTSVSWNTDDNESQVTLLEGVYAGASLGNIPPYINAGPDIFIGPSETTAQITEAVASDPDGFIQSLLWERIEGDPGESYSSPSALNPLISGLTSNAYTFRLTGTDNAGSVASDTMRVLRKSNYTIEYVKIGETIDQNTRTSQYIKETYKMNIVPDIPANVSVNLNFKVMLSLARGYGMTDGYARYSITKNGNPLYYHRLDFTDAVSEKITEDLIGYNLGDELIFVFDAEVEVSDPEGGAYAIVDIEWLDANFVNGLGVITNLPAPLGLMATV